MSKRNVVHIEIPATNGEAAGKFYHQLFGWEMSHDAEYDYTNWRHENGSGGGFTKVAQDNPVGQVMVYIDSDDIDADLRKVEKLGGTVVQPKMEIPGIGWYGVFQDPTGNRLALYTSMNPPAH